MKKRFNKGFVLVEVFLAAALLGGVLLAIFSAYTSGVRVWQRVVELRSIEDERFFIAFEKVKRELAGYLRSFDSIEFRGDSETLNFPYVRGLEIVKTAYSFDEGRRCFLRKTTRFSGSLKDEMSGEVTELFTADDVRMSYLFHEQDMGSAGWIGSFSAEENGVPRAVKFDITRAGKKFSKFVFIPH